MTRVTIPDDIERFAENLSDYADGNIYDYESFERWFEGYMSDADPNSIDALKEKSFRWLVRNKNVLDNSREKRDERRKRVIEKGNTFPSFVIAKREGEVLITREGKEVYKSFIVQNKKKYIRWRDSKGRFSKSPRS